MGTDYNFLLASYNSLKAEMQQTTNENQELKTQLLAMSRNKAVSSSSPNQFSGTNEAFSDLISKKEWYVGLKINGKPITSSNAGQMKRRFLGLHQYLLSNDMQESILLAAGYRIVNPVTWEK